jgi:hypothetical protein
MARYSYQHVPGTPKVRVILQANLNEGQREIFSTFCTVHSILSQTYTNYEIFIYHNGPIADPFLSCQFSALDVKIRFFDSLDKVECSNFYYKRLAMIEPHADFVLFTKFDNYYVPDFLQIMLKASIENNAGISISNCIDSEKDWSVFENKCGVGTITLGSYIARMNLVAKTDWIDYGPLGPSIYAEMLAQQTKVVKVPNIINAHYLLNSKCL